VVGIVILKADNLMIEAQPGPPRAPTGTGAAGKILDSMDRQGVAKT